MKIAGRHSRTLLVATVVLCGLAALPVLCAASACCGYQHSILWYNDASHDKLVGECTYYCDGGAVCWGVETSFTSGSVICCTKCSDGPAASLLAPRVQDTARQCSAASVPSPWLVKTPPATDRPATR